MLNKIKFVEGFIIFISFFFLLMFPTTKIFALSIDGNSNQEHTDSTQTVDTQEDADVGISGANLGDTSVSGNVDYKTDEQLTREAYVALGVGDIDENSLKYLFDMSNSKEEFIQNYENISGSTEDWYKDAEAYYAYSAELTPDAIAIMQAGGMSSLSELTDFYNNNKDKMANGPSISALAKQMTADKQAILDILGRGSYQAISAETTTTSNTLGNYAYSPELLDLWGSIGGNISNIDITKYQLTFANPADAELFRQLIEKFKDTYHKDFQSGTTDFDTLFQLYQNEAGTDDALKVAETLTPETHTYISKVVYTITKQSGNLGNIDVASQSDLNTVALKYSSTFANAYQSLTGNAFPTVKVLSKSSTAYTVEVNYTENLQSSFSSNFYDIIRNDFSQKTGSHSCANLKYNSYVPTIAFSNVTEVGVYNITANVYVSKYYDEEKTYLTYITEDSYNRKTKAQKSVYTSYVKDDGTTIYYCQKTYYPYRQKLSGKIVKNRDKNNENMYSQLAVVNDNQNVTPVKFVTDNLLSTVTWQVNVRGNSNGNPDSNPSGNPDSNPSGNPDVSPDVDIIVPPYGVSNSDISISNFISK